MASISSRNLVDAVLRVERMTFQDRERLADEVHSQQPNLLYAVLVLQRCGATLVQIKVVLNLLFVFHEAMKTSGVSWPVISEDVQGRCLGRVSGRVRCIEGLSPQMQAQAIDDAVATTQGSSCSPTSSASSRRATSAASRPKRKGCSCWRR